MIAWREVSTEEFYRVIGPQNVHPHIVTAWPFKSLWETPSRKVIGKSEIYYPEGFGLLETRYLLPA